jgi:hypothetical protein
VKTLKILLVALLLLLLSAAGAYATTGWYEDHQNRGSLHRINLTWATSSATTTVVTSHVVRWPINGTIYHVITDPSGTTAPTDNYDIYLYSTAHGTSMDVMGGSLTNRDVTSTEWSRPYISTESGYAPLPVWGEITITISGNSVNDARGQIEIFYFRD